MKVIITGGAGFIGTNAAKRFIERGHEVTLIDNLSRKGSRTNLDWLNREYAGRFTFCRADVRDADLVKEVFGTVTNPQVVLHLAAQVAVTTSVLDPAEDFAINAVGTFNVLEAVRLKYRSNPPLVLYASTNKVYGGMEDLRCVERNGRYEYENHPPGVTEQRNLDFHSPYGCSKGAADQYVIDYSRIYGIPTVSFRQSCIYGPRQFGVEDQGWVAWFTIATCLGKPITIYGDGQQVRDVLYVEDLVDAYEAAIGRPEAVSGQAFNIGGGPDNRMSVLALIEMLRGLSGQEINLSYGDWRPGDQRYFVCDIGKAERVMAWKPATPVSEGVRRLWQWVETNRQIFTAFGL